MPRILIIDEEISVSAMIGQWLSNLGYETVCIEDSDYGFGLLDINQFDLIVTEIIMQNKDGLEIISAIRSTNKTLPIIAITGGGKIAPEYYLEVAKALGANFTFKKPVLAGLFMSTVKACIG